MASASKPTLFDDSKAATPKLVAISQTALILQNSHNPLQTRGVVGNPNTSKALITKKLTSVAPDKLSEKFANSAKAKWSSTPSNRLNAWFKTKGLNDPFTKETRVFSVRTTKYERFVRLYDGENSTQKGSWVMRQKDIERDGVRLSPAEIRDKFALPEIPKFMCDVVVPPNAELFVGQAGPQEKYGKSKGGGTQFFIRTRWPGLTFDNERKIN